MTAQCSRGDGGRGVADGEVVTLLAVVSVCVDVCELVSVLSIARINDIVFR